MTGTPAHISKPQTETVVEEEKARIRQRRFPVADERPASEYRSTASTGPDQATKPGRLRRFLSRLRR